MTLIATMFFIPINPFQTYIPVFANHCITEYNVTFGLELEAFDPELIAFGLELEAFGPELIAFGLGAFGLELGGFDPELGAFGPELGGFGPELIAFLPCCT